MQEPPPMSPKKGNPLLKIILIISGACLILTIIGAIAFHSLIASGITRTFDNKFGEQFLKTSVGLIELHKVRYGKYPDSLKDLKFTGDWDQAALVAVKYVPSPKRDAYYIEVERGWMGKPALDMPAEFWKGTGYSESLKPAPDKRNR